jgi:hypothetical protein
MQNLILTPWHPSFWKARQARQASEDGPALGPFSLFAALHGDTWIEW